MRSAGSLAPRPLLRPAAADLHFARLSFVGWANHGAVIMLYKTSDLEKRSIHATDGEIGRVERLPSVVVQTFDSFRPSSFWPERSGKPEFSAGSWMPALASMTTKERMNCQSHNARSSHFERT
jgi:hypothetical protein